MKWIEGAVAFCVFSAGAVYLAFLVEPSLLSRGHYVWLSVVGWFGLVSSVALFVGLCSLAVARLVTGGDVKALVKRRALSFVLAPVAVIGATLLVHGT